MSTEDKAGVQEFASTHPNEFQTLAVYNAVQSVTAIINTNSSFSIRITDIYFTADTVGVFNFYQDTSTNEIFRTQLENSDHDGYPFRTPLRVDENSALKISTSETTSSVFLSGYYL